MPDIQKSKKNVQLIATLGPASNTPDIWIKMLNAGAGQFRLNTSHLTIGQTVAWLEQWQALQHIPLVLDLQGSKWRLGAFPPTTLEQGERVELIFKQSSNTAAQIPVPHKDFFRAASFSGKEIVLNDARVIMEIESINDESISARILQGGHLMSLKGITFRETTFRKESLGQKDLDIVGLTKNLKNIRYAISYIQDDKELEKIRRSFTENAYIIAKLERQSALDKAKDIAKLSDEVWICRGDLGAELGLLPMAKALYSFNSRIRKISVPVMLAGQVFEHLTDHTIPTRSEICYVYDALQDGYNGLVLSDETAIGKDPVNSCQMAALLINGES